MKYLTIRFGKTHKKRTWGIKVNELLFIAGKDLGLSKSEVKRYIDQDGAYLQLVEYEE